MDAPIRDWLEIHEVADRTGVYHNTVRNWLRKNPAIIREKLPHSKMILVYWPSVPPPRLKSPAG